MSTRVYIEANNDVVIHDHTVVKAGDIGYRITKGKEEGQVRFPGFCGTLSERHFTVLPEYDLETSISIISDFEGHYTGRHYSRGEGKYQFNIKFYHWNTSPLAEELLTDEQRTDAHYDILEHELRCLIDKRYCDGVLQDDFDWIKSAYTAGRSGGWLVLENDRCSQESNFFSIEQEGLLARINEIKDDISSLQEELTSDLEDGQGFSILSGIEDYEEELANVQEELAELQSDANLLARDLQLISVIIDRGQTGLVEYMKTEECWEPYYEHIQYEQRQMVAARKAWNTLKMIDPGSKEIERIMHDLKQVLPSEVYEAEFITYED